MSLPTQVTDGSGSGKKLEVTEEFAAKVQDIGLPPLKTVAQGIIFREFMKNSAGATDMRVNGSTTPQEYSVMGQPVSDLYIRTISIVIADQSATLNQFGNIGALTNGCELFYKNQDGEIIIADNLVSNFEFIRLANGNPSFGDGTSAFRAGNVSGNSEGYIPIIDLQKVFGLQWGIKLRGGTTDQLIMRINDDVTGVDAFNAIVYGFTRV